MKIAIMGAGLSGLACAKYLEDNGINPVIFEKYHRVGERFPNMEAVMQLMHRPIKDALIHLNKRYNINLLPAGIVHTLEVFSPNNVTSLTGYNLGYTSIRGNDERSWERQLAKQVKSEIKFNSNVTWQELEKDFDRVIIATGDPTISRELGVWQTDTEAFLMGCTIKGNFNLGTSKIWLNRKLSKQCMVYSAPFSVNEATVTVVAIPSSQEELESLWLNTVEELKITPMPKTEFKLEEYKMGRVSTKTVGKLILTGAASGIVEPFMGFGQIPSILSGIYAAKSILTGEDYNKLMYWIDKRYEYCLTIRKFVNTLDNSDFDKLVSYLNLPFARNLIANTNLPILKIVANLIRIGNLVKSM